MSKTEGQYDKRTVQTTLPAAIDRRLRECGAALRKPNLEVARDALSYLFSSGGLNASMFPKLHKNKNNRKWGAVVEPGIMIALRDQARGLGVEQTAMLRMALALWLDRNEVKVPKRTPAITLAEEPRKHYRFCPNCGERLYYD